MNDKRLKRVRDELSALVEDRRAERKRNAPCPSCGKTLSESVRIIPHGTEPCDKCEARATEQGVTLVNFWPPGGPLDTDDDPGDEAACQRRHVVGLP